MERPQIRLVPIDSIHGAEYNPRRSDAKRLALVRLSLQKLGWLLPVFINKDGLILSGHQRTKMARELGYTKVPVLTYHPKERKGLSDEEVTKAANLLFNRCTNDMTKVDNSTALKDKMDKALDFETVAAFPSVDASKPQAFRCLMTKKFSVEELLKNIPAVPQDLLMVATHAAESNCHVPLVVTESGRTVNGRGRVAYAQKHGDTHLWATVIKDEEADIANALLNFLSMDFDVEASYGDILRHNSFRRGMGVRAHLGQGFTFMLPASMRAYFDHKNKKNEALWKKTYGNVVLDFGAGQRQESWMLNEIGVSCLPFEPFCLDAGTNGIDYDLSRTVVRQFLDGIAKGMKFDSIFLSSVLQSVPFLSDRLHVIALIHSLCSRNTTFYACAKSRESGGYIKATSGKYAESGKADMGFCLDHEEGVTIADITTLPKIQKFYLEEEFQEMMSPFWSNLVVKRSGGYIYGIGKLPRPLDKEKLIKAIEFEFDLPYPQGRRMGLVDEAKAAWKARGVI